MIIETVDGLKALLNCKTWHIERALAAIVLAGVALASGGDGLDWLVAVAVLVSFAHGQVADRLREAQEIVGDTTVVECHPKERRYYVMKEVLWLVYFVAIGAWPAIAGVVLFLTYPIWRNAWRKTHPKVAHA